ncbi:MAG: GH92 family glycosyl hydrolase, partial [Rhodocyclaceae bacterium]
MHQENWLVQKTASPGYYSVTLKDNGVRAELSATKHAGFHRYTFNSINEAGVIIDVSHTLQSHRNEINQIEIINDHEIRGYKLTKGWAREHHVYFHAIFSQPFTAQLVDDVTALNQSVKVLNKPGAKVALKFKKSSSKEVLVKVGISPVDYQGAKNNVLSEIKDWDFVKVKSKAQEEWNAWLSKIDIKGGTPDQQKIFYTALYHTAISPNLFTDYDGRYRGMDKKIHQSQNVDSYTVFSLWDTFRAFHPLMTIINSKENEAWIRCMIRKYEEGGALPMWELAANETGTMIGYHAVPVIVDAYLKGFRNFDVEEAYKAIVHSSTYDTTIFFPDAEVRNGLMPMAKYYNETM